MAFDSSPRLISYKSEHEFLLILSSVRSYYLLAFDLLTSLIDFFGLFLCLLVLSKFLWFELALTLQDVLDSMKLADNGLVLD